uniref:DSBA-like thioredoxin domain-containing protein n=1 Tax=Calcidiscus leptoporus TaxID=127549 RepID=A0A7S0J3Z2_9EUKA|mmetsp:Transcript_38245/g.89513  ORF Transcript_38245/g.89513 Transcript_38245/m.89513 type:complete len:171 (+) Transcript_38245:218-730(+)
MIDPGTQPEGEPYLDYNRRRWGGDGWTGSMKRMGRKEGAPYANWVTWPNTTHCSRLLLLAEKHDLGDAVIGRLYRACYEEGQNVSLRETVARVATEAGVPGGAEYVMSDAGVDELMSCLRSSKARNGKRVSAAPTFSLRVGSAEGPSFSGAQEAAAWLDLLEQCADHAEA